MLKPLSTTSTIRSVQISTLNCSDHVANASDVFHSGLLLRRSAAHILAPPGDIICRSCALSFRTDPTEETWPRMCDRCMVQIIHLTLLRFGLVQRACGRLARYEVGCTNESTPSSMSRKDPSSARLTLSISHRVDPPEKFSSFYVCVSAETQSFTVNQNVATIQVRPRIDKRASNGSSRQIVRAIFGLGSCLVNIFGLENSALNSMCK